MQLHQRVRNGLTWRDDASGRFVFRGSVAPLHYPSTIDGTPDTAIDLTPVRITTTPFDGWRVVANNWHYALGQRQGLGDGWVGFGGRQGAHWIWSRLVRVGYLHYPTRAWDDIGGAPTYARAQLSSEPRTKTLGDQTFVTDTRVAWNRIWTTPGGGELNAQWRVSGHQLKEELVLNAAARTWIAANRPPSTPATETYFGFVFRLDASDIPRWLKQGVLQDIGGDFDDADGTARLELRDALDRLLAFLPISDALSVPYVNADGVPTRDRLRLRKRIWLDGDGNTYLLVGAKASQLATFRAGAITFDPTFEIAETAEDGWSAALTSAESTTATPIFGNNLLGHSSGALEGAWIWRSTGVPQGATITSAALKLYNDAVNTAGGANGDIFGYAVDSPDDFNDGHAHTLPNHHTRTSASLTFNLPSTTGDQTSGDLASVIQEIVDRGGFSGDIGLVWVRTTGTNTLWGTYDYSDGAALAAELTVEYESGGISPDAGALTFVGQAPKMNYAIQLPDEA